MGRMVKDDSPKRRVEVIMVETFNTNTGKNVTCPACKGIDLSRQVRCKMLQMETMGRGGRR